MRGCEKYKRVKYDHLNSWIYFHFITSMGFRRLDMSRSVRRFKNTLDSMKIVSYFHLQF